MDITKTSENKARTIVLLSLISIGWVAILYVESTQPPAVFLKLIPQLDKAAHFGAFAILGLLICWLTLKLRPTPSIPLFSMPLLTVTLCGAIEESLQMFVPSRTASIPDLLADISGAIFAILLANLLANKLRKDVKN